MNAKIKGGVRHLSFDPSPEALKRMQVFYPKSEWQVVKPAKGLTGVLAPTNFVAYDFLLWTHKGLSDAAAYKVAKRMPGKIAAANKSITGISIIGPITTNMMLGGIKIPKVPPAVIVPAANLTS